MPTPDSAPTVLKKIISRKHQEIAERSQKVSLDALREKASQQPVARGFVRAMEAKLAANESAVIAEITSIS